ncbi:protein of unknown function [Methylocella tundrae]|uniref:Integrase catalytic domain-containing protein n=1 Tax=Methylocella tundrae TaxID=227605 RepID=A0A4U8YZY4_METTU|nr:protein of unknown function [Methylocella tundrae]
MPPCRDADEAHGDRSDLPPAEHQQADAGAQGLPLFAAGTKIERPDHVWSMNITYIPMARGFVYLAAVVDWATRRVLSHRVSITMEADFCVEALEEALAKRQAGDIQHRPGQPVHQQRFHGCAAQTRRRHQHGRQGRRLARQCARRAANGAASNMRRFI